MVTATPLGLLRPVNDSTTADPAAVEACPDVAVAVVDVAGVDADAPDDAVVVAAEAAVVAAGAAVAGGVEEEP